MTPTKLLIGQIFVVFAIVLMGVWFATQWAAAKLAYQPELGHPWFVAFGGPIYAPWALFLWWFSFEAYAPVIFEKAGAMAAGSGLVGCAAAIFGSLWRARQRNNLSTYGSARWAEARDVRKAGLLTESGVFLGRTGARYLRHDGPEHIMAFAPTRSGKGVGLVVPTLLGWSGSAVKVRRVERIVNGLGFTTIREGVNAVEAWLSSLPGQVYANVRQPLAHTLNLAHARTETGEVAGQDSGQADDHRHSRSASDAAAICSALCRGVWPRGIHHRPRASDAGGVPR